jgi:eukaryotic-like serine/threonine-protein kinase
MMLKTTKFFGEFRSVKFSRGSKMKSFALAFCLLMFASAFLVLADSTSTVKAQTAGSTIPSNLLQYEWAWPNGLPQQTYLSAGPGPSGANVAWKATIPGIAYIQKGSYNDFTMTAFNGYVFVSVPNMISSGGTYKGRFFAFDAGTGALVWSTNEGTSGAATKIDSTYMMMGNNLVKCSDGSVVWNAPTGFSVGGNWVPELKMFASGTYGWSMPDPTKAPTMVWNITDKINVGQGTFVYGDGKIFAFNQGFKIKAIDARTGNILWSIQSSSERNYGATYADGKLFEGGLDNNLCAWDANTGALLWTYNPGTYYGQWASGCGYAYGMVYEHNQDNYMYAINATTGKLVWRQQGPGIWYSNKFVMADGKVYVQMGENEYRDFTTGEFAKSEFNCYDAYTGKLIWTMPLEVGAGPAQQALMAYGNLYVGPTRSYALPGVYAGSLYIGEIWCISSQTVDWPQFLGNPAHSAMGNGPDNLQLKWKFQTGGAVVSSASCVNGVAYFGSSDANIYAVNANTGAKIWSFPTGFDQWSTPAVANGRVFTGADDGSIYAINAATGTQIWKTYAGGVTNNLLGIGFTSVRASPVFLNGRLYVGSLDGYLYCLNSDNGNVIWKFKGESPNVILASPAICNNAIYLASTTGGYKIGSGPAVPNGHFYKLDMDGNVIWTKVVPYKTNLTSNQGNFFFAAPSAAPDLNLVFLRNGYRETYGINMNDGSTVWTFDGYFNPGTPNQAGAQPQTDAACYAYGVVFVGNFYDITAINATNGQRIWDLYLSREINHFGITYSFDRIYAATEAGAVYVIDALSGAKISYYEFGTLSMRSAAVPYNGMLLIGGTDYNMYCFGEARVMAASVPKPQVLASDASISSLAVVPIVAAPNVSESVSSSSTVYIAIAAAVIAVAASTAAVVVLRKRR